MDYYSILGVNRNASDSDIRKAYKKASMQHHPDRGGDEEQFKKVNEAYSTLKDPNKRAVYDNPQPRFDTSNMNGGPFGHGGFEDMFASMFRRPHQNSRRNQDVRLKVVVDFNELFTGKNIIATYRLRNGQEKSVDVSIPQGIRNGDTIKFGGLGDNSIPNMPAGDLYIIVEVENRTKWRRDQDNVYGTIDVDCLELILGIKKQITTPDNRHLELNIKSNTKNGTTLSIRGYGIPNVHNHQKGNLYITINAVIPQDLNSTQLEKIKEVVNARTS
jgi:DnaJ-class molecular chaperone